MSRIDWHESRIRSQLDRVVKFSIKHKDTLEELRYGDGGYLKKRYDFLVNHYHKLYKLTGDKVYLFESMYWRKHSYALEHKGHYPSFPSRAFIDGMVREEYTSWADGRETWTS